MRFVNAVHILSADLNVILFCISIAVKVSVRNFICLMFSVLLIVIGAGGEPVSIATPVASPAG